MYKVWFRQIYCENFKQWVQQMIWCFIVIKIFPNATDLNDPMENVEGKKLCPYCYQVMFPDSGEVSQIK